eukprot:TRINITY_DN6534_c0_g1_i1.p1 TRINITY_DN6534_c0_g1~~TRINITY_DN6534_c0_g1_i1.p1  ORF type:complete len:439 (+),score=51.14 TRINITY_DN6534_c0_g1_i1:141-1457(+)
MAITNRLRYVIMVLALTACVGIWAVWGLRFGGDSIEQEHEATAATVASTTKVPETRRVQKPKPSPEGTNACTTNEDSISCTANGEVFHMSRTTCDIDTMKKGIIKIMESLHHGIYKVEMESGEKFAIKPECRPAAKWHGQQGWTEIALTHLSRSLLGKQSTVPCSKGMLLELTENFQSVIHKDQCGFVSNTPSNPKKFLGVALEWTPHKEEALQLIKKHHKSLFGKPADIPSDKRNYLKDISDVLVLDYITLNPDRKDKNWFYNSDKSRIISMDNGWGYAGDGYQESLCSHKMGNYLECPPVLQQVAKDCKKNNLQFCVFRRETVTRLRAFATIWSSGMSDFWTELLLSDPQLSHLLNTFNTWDMRAPAHPKLGNRLYSTALGRFVHSCPDAPDSHNGPIAEPKKLLSWLCYGIGKRIDILLNHVDRCIDKNGDAVLL